MQHNMVYMSPVCEFCRAWLNKQPSVLSPAAVDLFHRQPAPPKALHIAWELLSFRRLQCNAGGGLRNYGSARCLPGVSTLFLHAVSDGVFDASPKLQPHVTSNIKLITQMEAISRDKSIKSN
jgi:hypothetical protein